MSATRRAVADGLAPMLRIVARTERRAAVVWVLVLGVSMIGTAASIAALYDTPAKIHVYATAVTAGSALLAINGKVAGIDSLGGVIADEFGFVAAFLLPLLGISLLARGTRKEEESGRLEALLAGRIARHHPPLAALVVATATIVATVGVFAVGLVASGVPVGGSILYALSLGALAFVFAGLAALVAQLSLHSRGVYASSLLVLVAAYVLRGVGDVTDTWITWLSPLGWAEKTAPFGDQQWWVLAVPLLVGAGLGGVALRLAAGRDLGSAAVGGSSTGPARASARLRSQVGLAISIHRPATLGWLTGGVLLTGLFGALSSQLLGVVAGNPALSAALGMAGRRPLDGLVAATQVYLALVAAGYGVQAVVTLRAEEAEGRLETRLSGTVSRTRCLAAHLLVVLGGLLVVVAGSVLVLGVSTALSVGDGAELGAIVWSGLAYLPAELVLVGLSVALYGLAPRRLWLAWVAYGATAFIALLGPGLELRQWVLDLSPTTHVGNPPVVAAPADALTVLVALTVSLVAGGFIAFRRRGVPQG